MANPVLKSLADQVASTVGVVQSATVFINGMNARIQNAIDAALKNGATEAELKPVQDEVNAMKSETDALAAALAANP